VADYGFSEHAESAYEQLSGDQTRWPTLDAVEDAILEVAADPGATAVRARKFQDPACFAVPVRTPEGDWVVLWRPVRDPSEFENLTAGDVYVIYFGPLPDERG
jgi:hypothetical protein